MACTKMAVYHACTAWKMSKDGVFSGTYFPAFGLNTERYGAAKTQFYLKWCSIWKIPGRRF